MVSTQLKNMLVKMGLFPNFQGENKVWNHHLENITGFWNWALFHTNQYPNFNDLKDAPNFNKLQPSHGW